MELEHLLTKAACEETVLAFFHALDTRRYEAAAALMTEDGCWERQGRLLSGREQILDALNGRAPDRATCHVVTNLRLATLDGSRATVAYFLTAYESRPTEQGGAPRLVAIRECQDTLVATAQVAAAGQAQPPPSAARMSAGCRASGTESQLSNHSPEFQSSRRTFHGFRHHQGAGAAPDQAERGRSQVRQLSLDHPDITIADAYAIQREWVASKIAAGRRLVGHKIGLTSRAMQLSSQIDEPDYGALLDDMLYGDGAEIPRDRYIVPRVEVELASSWSAACKGRTRRCSTCWTPCAT